MRAPGATEAQQLSLASNNSEKPTSKKRETRPGAEAQRLRCGTDRRDCPSQCRPSSCGACRRTPLLFTPYSHTKPTSARLVLRTPSV